MRQLRQLSTMLDSMPPAIQALLAFFLIAFTCVSIYGRYNLEFGGKVFSNIPKEKIQSDFFHIVQYTCIPAFVTVGYLSLLLAKHS